MDLARQKGEITNDDVQYNLKISDSTAERYLEELTDSGKLERQGEKKSTIYRIK